MGKHVRVALALFLMGLVACSRKPPPPEPLPEPLPPSKPAGLPLASPDAFTADGSIKGSDTRVAWLEIPAAFKRSATRSVAGREVYEAEGLPFAKMCEFLSRRMFTGKVEMSDDRALYHAVMPLDMNDNAPRLNVLLTQVRGQMTLEIERLPGKEAKPLSDEAARQLLAKERERAH